MSTLSLTLGNISEHAHSHEHVCLYHAHNSYFMPNVLYSATADHYVLQWNIVRDTGLAVSKQPQGPYVTVEKLHTVHPPGPQQDLWMDR